MNGRLHEQIVEGIVGSSEGYGYVSKFGRNSDIDTGTPEDIWGGGGDYTGQPTGSPETVEVFSSDAADAAAGTGMRTIRIYGLADSTSTKETTEEFTLDGVTPVTSVGSWYRIYRAFGLTYGSGGINAGTITVRHTTTTANVFVQLPAERGQTLIAAWTVPASTAAWVQSLYICMGRSGGLAGAADVSLRVRSAGSGGYNAKRTYFITNAFSVTPPMLFPLSLVAGDDIKVRVDSVTDNNTQITAEMDILTRAI